MSAKAVLRVSVVLQWICVIASVGLSFVLDDSLPAPLQAWQVQDSERELARHEVLVLGVGLMLLPVWLLASAGLFFLQRWAAWLYLASLIAGYMLFPFLGPTVEHALSDAVDEVGVLFSGVTLGLAFFSDALGSKPAPP